MRVLDVGPRALLVEVDDALAAARLARWIREQGLVALDVVPAATSVLLDGLDDPGSARALLARAPMDPEVAGLAGPSGLTDPGDAAVVEIPVVYDGEDLAPVAEQWGTDVAGVVERHTGLLLTSAFCGFSPGFAYLAGLPDELAVPRLDTPRPRVAAGSVAVADRWCAVYPSASPGGWRLLGHTEVALWDVARRSPALLAPGTRVRFTAVRR